MYQVTLYGSPIRCESAAAVLELLAQLDRQEDRRVVSGIAAATPPAELPVMASSEVA